MKSAAYLQACTSFSCHSPHYGHVHGQLNQFSCKYTKILNDMASNWHSIKGPEVSAGTD